MREKINAVINAVLAISVLAVALTDATTVAVIIVSVLLAGISLLLNRSERRTFNG